MQKKKILAVVGIILAFVLTILLTLKLSGAFDKKDTGANGGVQVDTRATSEDGDDNPLANRFVTFDGFQDATLASDGQVKLTNPEENEDFLIKYTITNTDSNKVIFETDLIPSGEHVLWTPGETLEPGTYHIAIMQTPYWRENSDDEYMPLTAGNNDITITII